MPDQKSKLVKVPDLGIVAFPETMPDEQVASVIKEFRSKPTKNQLAHTHETSPRFVLPKPPDQQVEQTVQAVKAMPTEIEKKLKAYTGPAPYMTSPEFPNQANEGTYAMFGGDVNKPQAIQVPFSQVPAAMQKGYIWFNGDESDRYGSDLKAMHPSALKKTFTAADQSVTPQPGGDPTMNLIKSIDRAVYIGVPSFVTGIAQAAYTDLTGKTQGAFLDVLDPTQIPKGLYDQYQQDKQADPRMAQTNLVGSLLGMWIAGKVGAEAPLKVTSSIIPDGSIPSLVNARSIHANPAGEVRMGTDNVPTVWLKPGAWREYVRVAHPEEKSPEFIAGENVATDEHFRNLAGRSGLSDHPTWEHTQELLRKAHENSPRGTAALVPKIGSLSNAVRVLREEKIHAWQRGLSQNNQIVNSLKPQAFNGLAADMPKAMRDYLGKDYGDASNPMLVSEAAARFIANDLHGTTPAEAVQFLSKYFDAIIQEHGPNALSTLEHTRGLAKHLQEIIDEDYRSADRAATPGNIRGVPEGRQAGAPQPITATPAIQPAFSREQTKSPEFRNWFGNSKVVDETGQPKVVYHGTQHDFSEFRMLGDLPHGIFFTDNPEYASSYTLRNNIDWGANVKPAYVSIKNPASYEKFVSELRNDKLGRQDAIKRLQAQGYDGAEFTQAKEWQISNMPELQKTHVYVAFSPEQIKSAVGNRGTFDPQSANILFHLKDEAERRDPSKLAGTESFLFVSPNRFDLNLPGAERRLGGQIHKTFATLSGDLTRALGVQSSVNSSVGHWLGGAENSVVHEFPKGTDPNVIDYVGAILGKLGDQNAYGKFTAEAGGKDRLYAFWVNGDVTREKIASVLTKNGIENSTMEELAGGHKILVSSKGESLKPNIDKASTELGAGDYGEADGRAEFPGDYTDRAAASREFQRTIDSLEQKHPDWKARREAFESRDDYGSLHRLIRNTEQPFVEVTHGSTKPGLEQISPEKYGTGPQRGAEMKRMNAWPQYWEPRSYFQIKGTRGERLYQNLPHQYQALLNSENIYDIARDPEDLASLIPPELTDPAGRFTALEQIVKETGYDGIATPDGVIEVFNGTPAESVIKREGLFSRKPRTWKDLLPIISEDEQARNNTPEKQAKFMETINQSVVDPEEWDAAVKAGATGRLWYERSSRAFDALVKSQPDIFQPKDKNKFLNFIAALSPVQTVRLNLLMAINLWDKWNKAGRPMDVEWEDTKNFKGVKDKNAALYRIMRGGKKSFGVGLPSRLQNAIRALQDQKLSGPKVEAFGPNLGKDVNRSTNDTWMAVFAGIDPGEINRPHIYDAVSVMAREAGAKNGIPARQAQAAVWSFIKSLAEVSGWGNDRWRPPEEVLKHGLLTPDLVNLHAEDFADMLAHDEEIRARIRGIGGDLSALDKKLETYVPGRPEPEPASAVLTRLLGAARRLEAARADTKIQSHLAAKTQGLFSSEFSPEKMEGAFSRQRDPKLDAYMDDLWKNTTNNPFDERERIFGDKAGIEMYPFDGRIHISFLRTFEQGKGHGSEVMKALTDMADKHGVALDLSVSRPKGREGLSNAELRKWYERYGFKKERGDEMVREPKGTPSSPTDRVSNRPEGEQSEVRRASDFRETGNYEIEVGGQKRLIYRSPDNGWWYEDKVGHFTQTFLGFNKKEAVEAVTKKYSKPEAAFSRQPREELDAAITKKEREFRRIIDEATHGVYSTMSELLKDRQALKQVVDYRDKDPDYKRAREEVDAAQKKYDAASGNEAALSRAQTKTPEFKQWFGDSQVVDETGEPKVMYHATQSDISEFRSNTHFGTRKAANDRNNTLVKFFTETIKMPQRAQGANIMPVYLKIENPVRIPDLASVDEDTGEILPKRKKGDESIRRSFENDGDLATTLAENGVISWDEADSIYTNQDAMNLLSKKGYDGIVYKNVVEDPGHDSWIAFDPSQVKSAVGNTGSFDPKNPNIMFHRDDSGVNTYFDSDNFTSRRTTGHNMLDPESLLTGEEIAAGFTYENSHRVFQNQAHYDATVSGDVPSHLVPKLSPRRLNTVKRLTEPEKKELLLLEDKKWKKTITADELKRYYLLSDRDTASKHGLVLPAETKRQLDEFRNSFEVIRNLKAEAEKRNPETYQP